MDTLLNLKTFLQVARTGSFAETARRTGVAVSVVKKRVDQLEHHVGAALLERSTRRLVLSDLGTRHLSRLQQAAQELDNALAGVRQTKTHVEGHLRIKVPTTLNQFYLGDMLVAFQARHPRLSLEIMAIDRAVNARLEGFDMAVGVTPGSHGGVLEIGLCAIQRRLVAAPAYLRARGRPAEPRELLQHDVLSFQPTGENWSFQGPQGLIVLKLEPRLSSNDGQQLLRVALAGHGIASLSTYVVQAEIRARRLLPVLQGFPMPEFWIHLQVPEARAHLASVQALVGFLQERFQPVPPWNRAPARARGRASAGSPA